MPDVHPALPGHPNSASAPRAPLRARGCSSSLSPLPTTCPPHRDKSERASSKANPATPSTTHFPARVSYEGLLQPRVITPSSPLPITGRAPPSRAVGPSAEHRRPCSCTGTTNAPFPGLGAACSLQSCSRAQLFFLFFWSKSILLAAPPPLLLALPDVNLALSLATCSWDFPPALRKSRGCRRTGYVAGKGTSAPAQMGSGQFVGR